MSKLNKKGFTLIELLAVIAILAILMLLVTPQILTLFTEGKKNTFAIQAQNIYKAAEQQFLTDSILGDGPDYEYCYSETNAGKKLDISGSNKVYYKVVMNSSGKITEITVTDGAYYFTKTDSAGIPINEISSKTSEDGKPTTPITCTTP